MTDSDIEKPALRRSLTLVPLTLYGLGTTIGAGIYALIGEMALVAGYQMPVSFLIAAGLATLTGFSFVELSSRYPQAAGEAVYVQRGFDRRWLTIVVGLLEPFQQPVSSTDLSVIYKALPTYIERSSSLS